MSTGTSCTNVAIGMDPTAGWSSRWIAHIWRNERIGIASRGCRGWLPGLEAEAALGLVKNQYKAMRMYDLPRLLLSRLCNFFCVP